jgi:hypothetical protein
MKKCLLALALVLAISPLTFAQTNPPSQHNSKKKNKKGKKAPKKGTTSGAQASK